MQDKTLQKIKLDERNHVEKPLLNQLAGLEDDQMEEMVKQLTASFRQSFP